MYQIEIESTAQKVLKKLPQSDRERVAKSIAELANNPRPFGCKKLQGNGRYRIRSGNYRVIYEIHEKILLVKIIKPTIRGKRISVQTILEFLSAGETNEEILKQYPSLEEEDIKASLRFASELMNRNYVIKSVDRR